MADGAGSLIAPLAAALVDEASRRGVPRAELLHELTLEDEDLHAADKRVELRHLLAAWEHAMRTLEDPSLPIAVGKLASVERFDVLGYALYTRPSIRDGLETLLRFHDVINDTGRFRLESGPSGTTRMHWERGGPRTLGMRVANEQLMAAAVSFTREVLGVGVDPVLVLFRHAKPRKSHAHEEHFRAPIEWGADCDAIDIADAHLDRPPRGADPTVASYFGKQAESALARVAGAGTWVQRVARAVEAALPNGIPTVGEVAERLGTSERTARRRLAAENETFDGIVVRVQHGRADELLASAMPLRDVAIAVGFADASAFSRAYRRWTGKSPSASRRDAKDSR